MSLSFAYNIRHLLTRRLSSCLTLLGISMVVFVFVSTLMLADGLEHTLSSTGELANMIAIRQGALNEIQSGISREHAAIVLTDPGVERTPSNEPVASTDLLVLLNMKRRAGTPSNVNIRGVSKLGLEVRSAIKLVEGRLPTPGTQELMAGNAIAQKFLGVELGKSLRMVGTEWPVVGRFDAGNSGFSSEIWGDVEILMPAFKRERFSSVTFRTKPGIDIEALKARIESNRQLNIDLKPERRFYEDQSYALATFIRYLGTFVTIIFSLAAVIGCMITMYAAVAYRTREIGVLRALGFSKATVLDAFLREAALISALGGVLGVGVASLLSFLTVSTTNFQTFAEVSFGFTLTLQTVLYGMCFAVIMGVAGALLPAFRASRMKPVAALRA